MLRVLDHLKEDTHPNGNKSASDFLISGATKRPTMAENAERQCRHLKIRNMDRSRILDIHVARLRLTTGVVKEHIKQLRIPIYKHQIAWFQVVDGFTVRIRL